MRKFKIDTKPYTNAKIYKKANIEIEDGVTVLVGCNGSGKTTLLRLIEQQLEDNDIPFICFDNLKDGGKSAISEAALINDFNFMAEAICSSEGENIVLNMCSMASKIGKFIQTNGEDKSDVIDNLIKSFKGNKENLIKEKEKKNEYWILLDAIDSGLSIDNVIEIKQYLFDTIIKDSETNNFDVYIIVSANEYEMCVGEKCFDVQNGVYKDIKCYDDFKDIIINSRQYKDKINRVK